jgi:hypothetical protein
MNIFTQVITIEGKHYTEKRKCLLSEFGYPKEHCKTFQNKLPITVYYKTIMVFINFFFFIVKYKIILEKVMIVAGVLNITHDIFVGNIHLYFYHYALRDIFLLQFAGIRTHENVLLIVILMNS